MPAKSHIANIYSTNDLLPERLSSHMKYSNACLSAEGSLVGSAGGDKAGKSKCVGLWHGKVTWLKVKSMFCFSTIVHIYSSGCTAPVPSRVD